MQQVYNFLKDAGTYYLATIKEDKPTIRPIGTINIFKGKLYFQTGKKKDMSKEMIANPNIAISAMNKKGQWIRISAKAYLDDSIECSEAMLQNYPELRGMYTPGDGNCTCFSIEEADYGIYSFTEAPQFGKF